MTAAASPSGGAEDGADAVTAAASPSGGAEDDDTVFAAGGVVWRAGSEGDDGRDLGIFWSGAKEIGQQADPRAAQAIELHGIGVALGNVSYACSSLWVGVVVSDNDVEHDGNIRDGARERPTDILSA